MTEITDNQKFGMIEAISHLVHRDYDGIGDDFKRLDFIPEEVMKTVDESSRTRGAADSKNFLTS